MKKKIKSYLEQKEKDFNEDISIHTYKRGKNGPALIGNIINLSNINSSLSNIVYEKSKNFKLNIKLINTILLIENNYGMIATSSTGAKGISQTKDELRKKYFPNDSSSWAYFMTTFHFLDDEGKNKYNLKIDNIFKDISPVDFAIAVLLYHEGTTRLLNNIDDILTGKGKYLEGKKYLDKAMTIYYHYKFKINIDKERKKEIII